VLPPIRTLTVGPGIPPGQPADGFGRVADCHRRFGLSPTPEHVQCLNQCAMPGIPQRTIRPATSEWLPLTRSFMKRSM
jgi:hypothetical protein